MQDSRLQNSWGSMQAASRMQDSRLQDSWGSMQAASCMQDSRLKDSWGRLQGGKASEEHGAQQGGSGPLPPVVSCVGAGGAKVPAGTAIAHAVSGMQPWQPEGGTRMGAVTQGSAWGG